MIERGRLRNKQSMEKQTNKQTSALRRTTAFHRQTCKFVMSLTYPIDQTSSRFVTPGSNSINTLCSPSNVSKLGHVQVLLSCSTRLLSLDPSTPEMEQVHMLTELFPVGLTSTHLCYLPGIQHHLRKDPTFSFLPCKWRSSVKQNNCWLEN